MEKTLREYQLEAVAACLNNPIGRIVLPTGSGKTTIALEFVAHRINGTNGIPIISVIFVPRIILGKQWIRKAFEVFLKEKKLRVGFVNISSGGLSNKTRKEIEEEQYNLGFPVTPIISSTKSEDLLSAINCLLCDNISPIAICTYHSNQVIARSKLVIDTVIHDECHYVALNNEFANCLDLYAARKYFLTATPRVTDSDNGMGMNNEEKFGPIIYQKSPAEIIRVGAIVGPRIHVPYLDDPNISLQEGNHNGAAKLVCDSFVAHKRKVKEVSANPDRIGGKLLVVCDGQKALEGIVKSVEFETFRAQHPEVKMFALCTEYGIMINGERDRPPVDNSKKEDFLRTLGELDQNDDAIILHVDMIAEGLDVPAITGVLFLRNCGQTRFLQNEGRAARLHEDDARRIESGELKVGDYSNYVKSNCFVILPYFLNNRNDFFDRNTKLIRSLRNDFNFDPTEDIIIDNLQAATKDITFEEAEKVKKNIISRIMDTFKEIHHKIENEEWEEREAECLIRISNMSHEEKMYFLKNLRNADEFM